MSVGTGERNASAGDEARGPRAWRAAAGLAIALWTCTEVWAVTLNAINGHAYLISHLPGQVMGVVAASALSLACHGAIRWSRTWRLAVRGGFILVTIVACSALYALCLRVISLIAPVVFRPGTYDLSRFVSETIYWVAPFLLWSLVALVLDESHRTHEREARLSAALIATQDAEIRALRYQINPHFLYNALNSVSALVLDGRNAQAERMLMGLSDFFRASLTNDPLGDARLGDEIAQQRLYLEIEQVRFADRLRVVIDAPAELSHAKLPSLILQPLVENAVKHGVHPPGTETLIQIAAWAEGQNLRVRISDNGPGGSASPGTGVGLENVRRRLVARFGDRSSLKASPLSTGGFAVTITLPLDLGAS